MGFNTLGGGHRKASFFLRDMKYTHSSLPLLHSTHTSTDAVYRGGSIFLFSAVHPQSSSNIYLQLIIQHFLYRPLHQPIYNPINLLMPTSLSLPHTCIPSVACPLVLLYNPRGREQGSMDTITHTMSL